jgi:hypothetical protein
MKRSRLLPGGLAATGLLLLSACVSQKDTLIRQGYPLACADGLDDGCHSGHKTGGGLCDEFNKDPRRFDAESQYARDGQTGSGNASPRSRRPNGRPGWSSNNRSPGNGART